MKLGVLYSGGKDSTLAALLTKEEGHELSCLISIERENKYSYMFHTPSVKKVKMQALVMGVTLIIVKTKGEKEEELKDLEFAIRKAVKDYGIEGLILNGKGLYLHAYSLEFKHPFTNEELALKDELPERFTKLFVEE